MISVSEALDALFTLANPLDIETVPLSDAAGRVLAVPAVALAWMKAETNFSAASPGVIPGVSQTASMAPTIAPLSVSVNRASLMNLSTL